MDTEAINEKQLLIELVAERSTDMKEMFFIQVGSNDGKTLDPIHDFVKKHKWNGILVEPVPYIFKKLLATYKDFEGLTFENVAIDSSNGSRDFYHVKENDDPEVPFWYSMVGSFNREVLFKHKDWIPNFEKYYIISTVNCMTFTTLLNKHQVKKIDLLHIDTEGHDFEVLKLIPFDTLRPRMILFEHKHLTEEDNEKCSIFLEERGYSVIRFSTDTFAC